MTSQTENSEQVLNGIITQEQASDLVSDALDCDLDEPERFVKLLVVLYDNADGYLQEAIYRLIRGAYNYSLVHSFSMQDYMAAIRAGRNPLEDARAKEKGKSKSRKKH